MKRDWVSVGKVTPLDWVGIQNKLKEEGHWKCTVMYKGKLCSGKHEEGHHGIWGGDYSKGRKKKRWVDVEVNYQPVCHNCNVITRRADREENRLWNIERQMQAGYDVVMEFYKLPVKYRLANKEIRFMIERIIMEVG